MLSIILYGIVGFVLGKILQLICGHLLNRDERKLASSPPIDPPFPGYGEFPNPENIARELQRGLIDGTVRSGPLFEKLFGDPDEVAARFRANPWSKDQSILTEEDYRMIDEMIAKDPHIDGNGNWRD